jgi:hypothetical protein
MMKRYLLAAAVLVPLVPGIAAAQSAFPDPAVPGSGYQISEAHSAGQALTSAEPVDPSVPGDGYQIPRIASQTAPAAPAMNQNGTYPSHWIQQ